MLQISLITAATLALVNLWISTRAVQARVKSGVLTGDGGNETLLARMRAHSNFAESVPLPLIVMLLIEMTGASKTALIVAGSLLVLARIAHPLGMERPAPNIFRAGGMLITTAVTLGLAIWGLIIALN